MGAGSCCSIGACFGRVWVPSDSEGLDGVESWTYPAIAEGCCWDGLDVRILVGWCACVM